MNEYLSHSGVKGMSWGNRRYQNPDGTWTELGKERRRQGEGGGRSASAAVSAYLKKRKEQRVAKREEKRKAEEELEKQKAAAAEAKREEQRKAEEEKIETLKKEAIASGDVNKIAKYAHLMTTKELEDAQKRADYLDKILKSNTRLTRLDKIEKIVKKGTSYANTINDAKKAWNNLFPKSDDKTSGTKSNPNIFDIGGGKNKQDTANSEKNNKKDGKGENKLEASKTENTEKTDQSNSKFEPKMFGDLGKTVKLHTPKIPKGDYYPEYYQKNLSEHIHKEYLNERLSGISSSVKSQSSAKDVLDSSGMYDLKDIKLDDILKKRS